MPDTNPASDLASMFAFFNEVGIINQLSSAMFEARLPPGFLVSQFAVLNHLVRVCDGRTPLDLARAFQVPKTTMTHTLALLEKHGLVRLAPNPQDGRSKCVWITEAGVAFRERAIAEMQPEVARIAARYPIAQIAALLPVLSEIRRVMDDLRNSQS